MKNKRIFIIQLSLASGMILLAFLLLFFSDSIRAYIIENREDIIYLTIEQCKIFFFSAGFAILVAFVIGYFLSKPYLRFYANASMQIFNIGMAVPTLAVLAISMLFFGIGFFPAWITLVLITLMPVVRNTYVAFIRLESDQLEAARGMGMNPWQIFSHVELPQALPLVFAGIRSGIVFNVGTLPLVFIISTASLGELIFIGLRLDDASAVIVGSALTALMAIVLDTGIHILSHFSVSRGIADAE